MINEKKINTSDVLTAFIVGIPIFLLSLKIFISASEIPNALNVIAYLLSISAIYLGVLVEKRVRNTSLNIILMATGVFATVFLATYVLKDFVSLAFVGVILIPATLIFLLLDYLKIN